MPYAEEERADLLALLRRGNGPADAVELHRRTEGRSPVVMNDVYREHADTYADFSADNPVNARYDRPAILSLTTSLQGKAVLELGCAAGLLTEQLVGRGADVLALDREPRLLSHARQRLGDRARFATADLERPLDMVPSGSADVVVASLVLHYVEHWDPLLAELHRCLRPGGSLVFSVHHPITGWNRSDKTDYHRVETITEAWHWAGHAVTATMYRRPLADIFGSLTRAGFRADAVDEPLPESLPDDMDETMRVALTTAPVFLFVRAIRGD